MVAVIVTLLVGVVCVVLGISNRRGNIESLHSYHRNRVSKEDRIPFGKRVGLGMIIIGCGIILQSILTAVAIYTDNQVFATVAIVIMMVSLTIGLHIAFTAMKKYNQGIF